MPKLSPSHPTTKPTWPKLDGRQLRALNVEELHHAAVQADRQLGAAAPRARRTADVVQQHLAHALQRVAGAHADGAPHQLDGGRLRVAHDEQVGVGRMVQVLAHIVRMRVRVQRGQVGEAVQLRVLAGGDEVQHFAATGMTGFGGTRGFGLFDSLFCWNGPPVSVSQRNSRIVRGGHRRLPLVCLLLRCADLS